MQAAAKSILLRPHTTKPTLCLRIASRFHLADSWRGNLVKPSYDHVLCDSSKWRQSMQSFSKLFSAEHLSGKEIGLKVFLGVSLGGLCFNQIRALPKYVAFAESEKQENLFVASPKEDAMNVDGDNSLLLWLRKLWIPSLLVIMIWMRWKDPLSLTINVAFLLLSTKPAPSSFHLWAEKRRLQEVSQRQGLDRLKAQLNLSSLMHVEVQDYVLFCVATATGFSERLTVVGIFGEWWVVHSSSWAIHYATDFKLSSLFDHLGQSYEMLLRRLKGT